VSLPLVAYDRKLRLELDADRFSLIEIIVIAGASEQDRHEREGKKRRSLDCVLAAQGLRSG
jgi:hypothetical protein